MKGVILLYSTQNSQIHRLFCGHTAGIVTVLVHPNSEFVGSTSCDGTIRLWSISQCACVRLYKAAGIVPTSMKFSHSGRWIMTTSNDGHVAIIDGGSGRPVKVFKASDTVIMTADFSMDDSLVVGYDRMGNFFVWETHENFGAQLAGVRIDRVRAVSLDCLNSDEFRIIGCAKQ
jgi:WD40 repeat protein